MEPALSDEDIVARVRAGEVASRDTAEETIKTRLFRALALLKDALMERAIAIGPGAFEFHLSRCDRVVEAVLRKIGHARAAF